MKQQVIKKISTNIYKRFPEVAGIRPKVRLQSSKQNSGNNNERYLLTFHAKVRGPGGKAIPRQVRVVANTNGKIYKVTTSR
jgi:hypothetical protein